MEGLINLAQLRMVVMIDLLRKLGLNKYEADAYLALVKLGSASAFNISKASGVPFGRIYDSLNVLEIKGLVEVVPTKPKKYKAVNPESALNNLVDESFNELTKIRSEIKSAVVSVVKSDGVKDLVSVNSGRVNFSKRVTEHFGYKGEFFATSESFGLEKSFPALNRYLAGDPKSRYVLVDASKSDVNRLKDLVKFGVNVRDYPLSDVRFLVSDEHLVTISFREGGEWFNINVSSNSLGKAVAKLLRTAFDSSSRI